MLNKRTHILLDETIWKKLQTLARQRNTSIGHLTRSAIERTYLTNDKDLKEKRKKAIEEIRDIREKLSKTAENRKDSVAVIRKMREERTKHLISLLKKN